MTESPSHAPTYDETMRRGEIARLSDSRAECVARIEALERTATERMSLPVGICALVFAALSGLVMLYALAQPRVTPSESLLIAVVMGGIAVVLAVGGLWIIAGGQQAKARVAVELPQWQAALADLDRQITALGSGRAPSVRR
jgi:hypothetical protein